MPVPRTSRRAAPEPAEIRDARPDDLPALARLGAKLARLHHALDAARFFLPDEPIEPGYAWWLGKERASRRAVVLAAEQRGRIVGYAYGRLEPRDWNTLRDACGVGVDLWVEPRARRGGLGTRLVEALAARLAERGAPTVVLHVAARNARARAVFAGLGFRETIVEMAREVTPPARRASPRPSGRPRAAPAARGATRRRRPAGRRRGRGRGRAAPRSSAPSSGR
jgi:ribosomal protein S18 acetylase RimI-like enzyme